MWDEAVKISGADSDFHRRDLWEAIEAGAYPEWELGVQIFTEEQAEGFTFDVLDATKIVPEELVPVFPVGKLVLNRNPDNFFAETEQVAFCVAHVVPGVDFSNDPLLAGRIHSYVDTQISRLGGANFHEIPINAPLAAVHNNQRDGMHRQAINRGRVSYEPNSLGGGCPFQAGKMGFVSFPEPRQADDHKVRGKPDRFADHYTQARLFWNSQTPVEKTHIVKAFRFELSKVQTPAIRERMVSGLLNVAPELGQAVAKGLGIRDLPPPMPKVRPDDVTPGDHRVADVVAVRATGVGGRPDAARRHPRRRRLRRRRRPGPGRAPEPRRRGAPDRRPVARRRRGHVRRAARRGHLDRGDAGRALRRGGNPRRPASGGCARHGRTGAGVPEGPVPATARRSSPRARAPVCCVPPASPTRCPTANPIPAC